jgi:hypothetical protein
MEAGEDETLAPRKRPRNVANPPDTKNRLSRFIADFRCRLYRMVVERQGLCSGSRKISQ